jgi:ferredoxin-NADP reductase
MASYIVKIKDTEYLNSDVKRFVLTKPAGYKFTPGQSVWVSINLPGQENEKRPFTFTGLNKWRTLELMIKIYNDHDGITHKLDMLGIGAELIISEPWGTIQYKGDGVFIAAGSGITPFIAILRQLKEDRQIQGDSLIFSNRVMSDLFLYKELTALLGANFHPVFTRQNIIGFRENRIDIRYLKETVKNFNRHFYVCGPREFVEDIMKMLTGLGINPQTLVFEEKATGIQLDRVIDPSI